MIKISLPKSFVKSYLSQKTDEGSSQIQKTTDVSLIIISEFVIHQCIIVKHVIKVYGQ